MLKCKQDLKKTRTFEFVVLSDRFLWSLYLIRYQSPFYCLCLLLFPWKTLNRQVVFYK